MRFFEDMADVKPSIGSMLMITLIVIVMLNALKFAVVKLPFTEQIGVRGLVLNT